MTGLRRLAGRRVLITGAGAGMGRATALRMAEEGASVVAVVDRVADRLDSLRAELKAMGTRAATYQVDLADPAAARSSVERAVADLAGLDVVVSNAGASRLVSFVETSLADLEHILAVNFIAGFVIGQAAARHMIESGKGGVILYTAATAEGGGIVEVPAYSASKAALINLVKAVAPALGPYGIRVNVVSPGFTETSMTADVTGDAGPLLRSLREQVPPQLPLRRMARPEEIAAVFAFLASDDASYITGANLIVDGGLTAPVHGVKWMPPA